MSLRFRLAFEEFKIEQGHRWILCSSLDTRDKVLRIGRGVEGGCVGLEVMALPNQLTEESANVVPTHKMGVVALAILETLPEPSGILVVPLERPTCSTWQMLTLAFGLDELQDRPRAFGRADLQVPTDAREHALAA